MTIATFETPDFLCVGPYCWGRSKTARDAYRAARANMPTFVDGSKATFGIWRIADQTDQVTVHDTGSFTCDNGKPRLVWKGDGKVKLKDVPELPIDEIEA